jgi:hypothetical protein
MANSHGRKIAIREIVKSLLIQEGSFTEHKMMQYMDIALRGLKELSYDVSKDIKYAVVLASNNLTVAIPPDCVQILKIGLVKDGRFVDFGSEESISFSPDTTTEAGDFFNDSVNWYANYRNGENTGGAYGHGGGHKPAYYRINSDRNLIHLSSEFKSGQVAMEYISDGIRQGGTSSVHVFLEEAIRAWIWWKVTQRKRDTSPQEKELARRDWFNEKRIAKSRMQSFTKEEALRVSRKGNKQAPKF